MNTTFKTNLAYRALPLLAVLAWFMGSCTRQPILHLHEDTHIETEMPLVTIDLDVYWNYIFEYDGDYNWRDYWYYGWDDDDRRIFGEIGYTKPSVFNFRRYHTGSDPEAPHSIVLSDKIYGYHYENRYSYGYWDLLLWNEIYAPDGVQSLMFDESSSLDYVRAYTNRTLNRMGQRADGDPCYYQPEELFGAYEEDVYVSPTMEGFEYDEERDLWVKRLSMTFEPLTYIYLPQIILHHNDGRVEDVDGNANLTGMAASVKINSGLTGSEAITVYSNVRMKKHMDCEGEDVDIIGGKLLTFGICGLNPNRVVPRADVHIKDDYEHRLYVNFLFNNGKESTYSWDVTDQIRRLYKGGVLTVEVDCDTLSIPQSPGGSGFDAVVEDEEDGGTHEIEM